LQEIFYKLWKHPHQKSVQYAVLILRTRVSTDLYNELIAGQQEGCKLITSDENGLPVLKSPVIDYVARAENQRMQLLAHADNVTADWRVELMLGDISSTDKEKLSAWMNYKKEVKAVDTSTAPEISWPELPEA
ncbi:Prophage tail fiber assembly protein TfaE, partial [Escherichia coli]